MPQPTKFHVYMPIPEQNDLMIAAAALSEQGRPGIEDIDGEYNRSGAIRTLLRDYKEALKQQPSPIDGLSLWEYVKQGVKAEGKLPWPDKEAYEKAKP